MPMQVRGREILLKGAARLYSGRGSVMKYQITLEVESEWAIDQLIKDHHGALLIGANHSWKVLEAYEREDK